MCGPQCPSLSKKIKNVQVCTKQSTRCKRSRMVISIQRHAQQELYHAVLLNVNILNMTQVLYEFSTRVHVKFASCSIERKNQRNVKENCYVTNPFLLMFSYSKYYPMIEAHMSDLMAVLRLFTEKFSVGEHPTSSQLGRVMIVRSVELSGR